MKYARRIWFVAMLMLAAPSFADAQGMVSASPDWKVEVTAEYPAVKYCTVVTCAPDGRIFLAEDSMDQVGPANKPGNRLLCRQLDGTWTVFAENLYAVFGLEYLDGKLYVHHCPKLSVFDDDRGIGKNRVDLIECTNPRPWANMNDHIPSGIRLGMDGWLYMSTGDKGIFGAVGRDGSKAEIRGGGIMRLRPDGTRLEVYSTGTRNHLEVALNAEDEKFTYDNTDDGLGWNTRFTHMVDGGYYGYPYDYRKRQPHTLWMIADYGGGSPTGGIGYNEDALPEEYRGNLFMLEWGKGQLVRFAVERQGASYRIKQRDIIVQRVAAKTKVKGGVNEFRPVGIAISPDGMSFYIGDWNYNGWANRKGPMVGRLVKVTYTGKSLAAPKPDWLTSAAMGRPFKATNQQLVDALGHPAQSVRLVAMRRLADRGADVVPLVVKVVQDSTKSPEARWSAIWTLDRIDGGKASRAAIVAALNDADLSIQRQAARQLGESSAREAIPNLAKLLGHSDRSVRFQAATALGRIGDVAAVAALLPTLDEADLFARYASFTALNRIGRSESPAWSAITAGLDADKAEVRDATLFAFRGVYDVAAIEPLAAYAANNQKPVEVRKAVLKLLAELDLEAPAWDGKWWNIKPAIQLPPARTISWAGTAKIQSTLRSVLRDSQAPVRQGAAEAMVASNDPVLTTDLLSYVPKELDSETRRNMLGILAAVKKPNADFTKAGNRLAAEVLGDPKMDPQFLVQALAFAVNLPSVTPELTEALMKRANTNLSPTHLVTLLETLNKVKTAEVTSAMVAQLKHRDDGVRLASVRLLADRKGDSVAAALIGALKDKSLAVRKEVVAALTLRGEKTAVPALLDRLADADLRFDVITALAQTPDIRALSAYLEGLGGKNVNQREACLNAVAAMKKEALPAIEARLAQKPPLSADVVVQLQKAYADDAAAAKSRLFSIEVRSVALEEYASAVAKTTGDAERGRKIFFDAKGAACSRCHAVQKTGGDVGPDLSSIGFKYSRLQLIEEVLNPSKNILDGYESFAVELASGKVLTGIVRGETADELTLIDNTGAKQVIKQGDVESKKKTGKSVMPDGLQGGLSPSDFGDLIRFLESLRDKAPEAPKKTGRTVESYRKDVQPILAKYCFDCHADGAKKGNVAFDTFKSDDELVGKHEFWHAVLKNTRASIMPPAKKPRPTPEEQKVLERWIKYGAFGIEPKNPDPGRVTLRRLNRVEYRNTIRDLLGVDFDTDKEFPPDDIGYGFDNIGDVLSFSPLLAEKYMAAATRIVAAAVPADSRFMPVKSLTPKANPSYNKTSKKDIGEDRNISPYFSYGKGGTLEYAFKVDQPGDYRIRTDVEVRGPFDFDASRIALALKLDGQEKMKVEHIWINQKPFSYELTEKLQPGQEYRVELEGTPLPPKEKGKKQQGSTLLQKMAVRIEGPLDRKQWPQVENYQQVFFGGEPPVAAGERRNYAREVIGRFVRKAFRRPAEDKVLDRLTNIAELIYKQPDKTFEQGVSQAMVAVLASPRFLFRMEEADPKAPKGAAFVNVDELALASRLSYLLWSSMPDDELIRLADRGELRDNLKSQVQRMLKDPRAVELSRNFAGQWLKARNVDHVPLDAPVILKQEGSSAKVKLDADLRTAIRLETEMFFDHIVRTDRSVLELIDSDYTFLNETLAKFYAIPGIEGKEMRKFELPKESPRGGVLTHASVLMVTSNPTRTSPVKRGLFVLDNFLGTPTPPPPADLDIPNLDEAAEGAKGELTMRELMVKHRSMALCASCHARMDPLGLGLENFNALGLFRDKEREQPIDSGGKLITGESFSNIHELKRILKDSRRNDFYYCLTEKFLTYALGRGPEYYDEETIGRIAEKLERDQGRFSTLLMGIIESAPFQKRRNAAAPAQAKVNQP